MNDLKKFCEVLHKEKIKSEFSRNPDSPGYTLNLYFGVRPDYITYVQIPFTEEKELDILWLINGLKEQCMRK